MNLKLPYILPARLSSDMPRLEVKGDSDTVVARHLDVFGCSFGMLCQSSNTRLGFQVFRQSPPLISFYVLMGLLSLFCRRITVNVPLGHRDLEMPHYFHRQEFQTNFQDKSFTASLRKHGNTFDMTRQKWTK